MFIGLNPSTADEVIDDPTVRRCIRYAQDWGYGGLFMANIFGFRSTDPKGLLTIADPVGPENDETLVGLAAMAGVVVAAWGVHGVLLERGEQVKRLISDLHVLKLTRDGYPGHVLYLPKTLVPKPWT